ncbi:ATP-binding protein [Hydrocarboniphaga sp.]|uniref:ATP-binding protein n=2 Tax=Gammaproteobacteria TaxID=1236 RepID=UPI00058CF9F6|nr:MASE1 domain-containing protein [Hydrocarboniphaga sp.]MDZ4079552.1 MASE1 domain-containing protein [Hydrocarboniphaga sp.]
MVLAYVVGHAVLDRISYIVPVLPLGISPWNPPSGLTMFLLLGFGIRYWPTVPVACIVSEFFTRGLPTPVPLLFAACWITLVYSLSALVLKRRLSQGSRIESLADFGWFLGCTLVSTLAVAAGYVAIFTLGGALHWPDFSAHFIRFWIGEANGILVVTPLLLTLRGWRPNRPDNRELLELLAQGSSLGLALWFVFREPNLEQFQFFYVLFLPMLWIVARHGLIGAVISLAATQLGLIAVVPGTELFAVSFIRYQFLMLSLCVTGLTMGALAMQRARADAAVHEKTALLSRTLQMAAAGELSSTLTHELNQPITASTNYLSACRLLIEQPELDRERLADTLIKADQEVRRAAGVVHRLRDFFQHGTIVREPVDLPALIGRVERRLAARAARLGISVDLRAESELFRVQADAVQLELVLNNLLTNALDAYEQAGRARGQVVITVSNLVADDVSKAPRRILIGIDDDGPGIPADLMARLFEPFTTSKSTGLGLGLAISRTLAEANGGELHYLPSTRGGSRFELLLQGL